MRHDCTREIAEAVAEFQGVIERANKRTETALENLRGRDAVIAEKDAEIGRLTLTVAALTARLADADDGLSIAEQALRDMRGREMMSYEQFCGMFPSKPPTPAMMDALAAYRGWASADSGLDQISGECGE
jgi:hypothetical protein